VTAYATTGVDGIFLVGVRTRDELEAIHAETGLPLVLGTASRDLLDRPYLASQGVRVVLTGHAPFQAAVRAMCETLTAIHQGATTADLRDSVAPAELLDDLTAAREYDASIARFLTPERQMQP
jgi:oxaloacetate decarboxylase